MIRLLRRQRRLSFTSDCRRSTADGAIGGMIKLRERTCVCVCRQSERVRALSAASSAFARVHRPSFRPTAIRPSEQAREEASELGWAECVGYEIIVAGRTYGADCGRG